MAPSASRVSIHASPGHEQTTGPLTDARERAVQTARGGHRLTELDESARALELAPFRLLALRGIDGLPGPDRQEKGGYPQCDERREADAPARGQVERENGEEDDGGRQHGSPDHPGGIVRPRTGPRPNHARHRPHPRRR